MTDFQGDIYGLRDILRKHLVGRSQELLEAQTTRELLNSLPPEARSEIARGVVQRLAGAQEDSARAAYIQRVNDMDAVEWLHGVQPGIPAVDRTFAEFREREGFPDVIAASVVVQQWMNRTALPMLTLSGPTGCGKSHLAIAAARELYAHDYPVIYRVEAALIAELRTHMGSHSTSVEDILQEFMLAPWLIIDDLGLAALGDWGREVMDRIINHRWENAAGLRTLVTTNLLGDQLPARIGSRLRDVQVGNTLTIVATDYRRQQR